MDRRLLEADALRQFMLEQPAPTITRALMLVAGVVFLLTVLTLVRRGRLSEELTPLWVAAALGVMALAVWFDGVRLLARAMGAWTATSALYFLSVLFLVFVCLGYAVRLSALAKQVRALAQEITLLRAERSDSPPVPEDKRDSSPTPAACVPTTDRMV
jgi:lysylphosphatidylglycerol synthetase-like protein (DUF2156 family)